MALWWIALATAVDRVPGPYGLIEILPIGAVVAVAAAIVGFALSLRRREDHVLQGSWAVTLTVMLHGMPALLYENLATSWAWKHTAIVEYLQREGLADRAVSELDVYHNWPGFFALNAWVVESGHVGTSLVYAQYAPILFNLLFVLTLYVMFTTFTDDKRVIWTAIVLFEVFNWVGQDYFAPQAIAFTFYLMLITILLRWYRTDGVFGRSPEPIDGSIFIITHPLLILLSLAIASTHQLTPIITSIVLVVLAAFRVIRARWPAIVASCAAVVWIIGPAWPFSSEALARVIDDVGSFQSNVNGSVVDVAELSDAAQSVATVSRALCLAVVVLATLGVVRRLLNGQRSRWIALLAVAPATTLIVSSYGGEVIFRIYLFALPFLAFLAASAFGTADRDRVSVWSTLSLIGATGLLVFSLILAAFGSHERSVFSDNEIAASEMAWVDDQRYMVIDGSANYPGQFMGYERFDVLTLDRLPRDPRALLRDDPDGTLARWIRDSEAGQGYVILTASQQRAVERLGTAAPDLLPLVRQDLAESELFEAEFVAADAVVYRYLGESSNE